jgi:hypothetical protein
MRLRRRSHGSALESYARTPAAAKFAAKLAGLGEGSRRGDLATERSCSGCDLCCTVLRVDELNKLGGDPCVELRRAGAAEDWGCGIHETRPPVCRGYRCLWLRGGLEQSDRPDRLGAVLDVAPAGAEPYLAIRERRAGTFDASSRLQAIAEQYRVSMPVRITCADEVMNPDRPYRVLEANGAEQLVAGEWVTAYVDGEAISHRRMPWLERWLRRLQLRFVAFKLKRQSRAKAEMPSSEFDERGDTPCP